MNLDSKLLQELLYLYRENVSGIVDIEEFKEDVRRFFYIARMLRKYDNKNSLNIRLLLNHTQIIYNVFGNKATDVFIQYIEEDLHPHLFGILFFLYRLPKSYHQDVNFEIVKEIEAELNVNAKI